MMSNPNPVGVFDSGVGGIGTLSACAGNCRRRIFCISATRCTPPMARSRAKR